MTSRSSLVFSLFVISLAILADANCQEAVQTIIGGEPLHIKGVTPVTQRNHVFVPVRAMAEALGAELGYDRVSGTLTVSSASGSGIMKVGDRAARIRGRRFQFPIAPYLYGGRVYAPIIFFNEMFDMALLWDPYFQVFKWQAIVPTRPGYERPPTIIYGPGRAPAPAPEEVEAAPPPEAARTAPAMASVSGDVVRVIPSDTAPKIVVRVGEKNVTYVVSGDAAILRGALGERGFEVPLGEVRPGDHVVLQFNANGAVNILRAHYKLVSGTVQSVAKGTILFETGDTTSVSSKTVVILPDNTIGGVQDIKAGDMITARAGPSTNTAYLLKIVSSAPATQVPEEEQEDQIHLNTFGPLRESDVLLIRFKAQPGGRAVFTIPGVRANAPMTEVEPGTYEGQYVVRPGDVLMGQPLKVTFITAGGETYTRASGRPLVIQTVGSYLPRITSPHQGQMIDSPVVVQGIAKPKSLIRVTVEYTADFGGVLPLDGTAAVEEVRANAEGSWQTSPLPANVPFFEDRVRLPQYFGTFEDIFKFEKEPPTVFTVTATSLGARGEEGASYSIQVSKQR